MAAKPGEGRGAPGELAGELRRRAFIGRAPLDCVQASTLITPRRIWSSSIALEQRLEVADAEALVAFPLDDLEEDRAEQVLGEYLQEQPLVARPSPSIRMRFLLAADSEILAVARAHAYVHQLIVGLDGVLQLHTPGTQPFDGVVDIVRW